jgi:hypothetical protein
MPPAPRTFTQDSLPIKSELRRATKGKVQICIAPIGRRHGRTRAGLSELIPHDQKRLLSRKDQSKINAALAERRQKTFESTSTSAQIGT